MASMNRRWLYRANLFHCDYGPLTMTVEPDLTI